MSDWTSNEAREFLSIIRGEAEKVVKDFGDRQSSIYACLAVVTNISESGAISVRLLSSPSDGSQDFLVRNRSGSMLEVGDSVWLHYWSDYTNVYIAMRNSGGDILALPYDAVSSNLLINGGFDVWQRGTSFANPGSGAYLADRWRIDFNGAGATRTISRQAFAAGQTDVPSNPVYYLRYAQSVAGSGGTFNVIRQCLENVALFSGKTLTLSFYAKASASTNINSDIVQNFGAGGSAQVAVSNSEHTLGTTWQKFTHTFTVPSVASKTIGANDFIYFAFAPPINATFTVDIANVQLNYGSVALPFVPRSFADELRLCQRYYEKSYDVATAPGAATEAGAVAAQTAMTPALTGNRIRLTIPYAAEKRISSPTLSCWDTAGNANKYTTVTIDTYATNVTPGTTPLIANGTRSFNLISVDGPVLFHWVADAEL